MLDKGSRKAHCITKERLSDGKTSCGRAIGHAAGRDGAPDRRLGLAPADQRDPWTRNPARLVRDRDAVYGADFPRKAAGLGNRTVLTPVRAPRANAIAERLVSW